MTIKTISKKTPEEIFEIYVRENRIIPNISEEKINLILAFFYKAYTYENINLKEELNNLLRDLV